ncbi:MAG: pilus assembly protein [Acidimicrobiia bacterium]|nr:pilus assembly protein [Acidimicrobiia bacterium]MDH5293941.1 pilus assembly protein [Acidimicrobiia bacterium]
MRLLRHSNEEGAAAVETAMVLGLLLMIALGGFEWGMAFRDWLAVTSGTREAARIGAQAGDEPNADCLILEAAAGSLRSIEDDQVIRIRIFRSNTSGAMGNSQVYRPALPTDSPGSLRCSTWYPLSLNYPESHRDNDGVNRHWLGVEIEFDHDWTTGFLWWSGSVCDRGTAPGKDCWTQRTIMHIEPDPTP